MVQNKELQVENRRHKSTTGVRVHDGVLSETILLLWLGRLGLCLLRLCHGPNLYVIYYNRLGCLWVIVLSGWCRLWYRGGLLS